MTADSLAAGRRRAESSPQAQIWLAVWRHSRVGWLGVILLNTLAAGPSAATALGWIAAPSRSELSGSPLQVLLLISSGLAGFGAGLLGASWVRLSRGGASRLQPGLAAAAHRAGVLQTGLLWLLSAGPLMMLALASTASTPGAVSTWQLLIPAAGVPALGMAMGLSALVFGHKALWIVQGAVVLSVLVVPALVRNGWLTISATEHQFGLLVLGVLGLPALVAILRVSYRTLLFPNSTNKGQALEWSELLRPNATASGVPSAWRGLWLPMAPNATGWRAFAAPIAVGAVMLLAINPTSFPWGGMTALMVGMWGASAGLGLAATARASPRLALVPGGWNRQQALRPLLLLLVRHWFTVAGTFVTCLMLLVGALWQPPWTQWAALPVGISAALVMSACTTLACMPRIRSAGWRVMATVGSQLLLPVAIGWMYRYDWPLAEEHPWSWLARSLVLLLMSVVLGAALVAGSRRAWQRIDWGHQPPLPSFALQKDRSPSRFSKR